MKFIKKKSDQINRITEIERLLLSGYKSHKINIGQLQTYFNNKKEMINELSEVEFQVFSQWGDDGIIQYLINKLDIPNKTFIEFGVENYTESNTRFLILNNNWTGLVLDASPENIRYIKNDPVSWACELYAKCSFITKENINQIIIDSGFEKEVGLLSIDIDGNDYWIWKEINCISPIIVIVEYNSLFGVNKNYSVPYDPLFVRGEKHPSNLYYGASLGAFVSLAKDKGYSFIGCNSKGNNAYFVRNDKLGNFKTKTVKEGFVLSKFREAQVDGEWVSAGNRIKLIMGMEICNTEDGIIERINEKEISYT